MIQKIGAGVSLSSPRLKEIKKNGMQNASDSVSFSGGVNSLSNYRMNNAMLNMNGIKMAHTVNFGAGVQELTDFEKSIIGDKEIRVNNLFEIPEDIHISRRQMPEKTDHLNAAGLNIVKTDENDKDVYTISNSKGNTIFVGKFQKGTEQLPILTYKQGKFMPEITVKDPSLNGNVVKMFAGSELIGDGFELKMPGQYNPNPEAAPKEIAFTGRTVITTLNKEDRTLNAVELYKKSGLQEKTIKGDYYDVVKSNDPTIVIPAGGFGERFYNLTRDKENKPSYKLPTDERYRILATTLNLAASAGIMEGNSKDTVEYLSQKHEISGKGVYDVSKYKTDGGAIAEALTRNIIRNDRDVIVLNADIFTNADVTRAYNALKTLPDAALVIPYYPVNPERAKSFGLLGVQPDENGNLMIKNFIEKPKYTSDAPMPNDFNNPGDYDKAMEDFRKVQTATDPNDENVYFANPGMYFMSKEAAKVLMAKGILDPNKTGLGADVMPKIVELANEGKLLDKKGNKLKVYTVPLEAKGGKAAVWDDIGTAEAYLSLIKDVAHQVQKHGTSEDNKYYGAPEFVMNDFRSNVDLDSGIVYDSKQSRDNFNNFRRQYNITSAQGNMFICS